MDFASIRSARGAKEKRGGTHAAHKAASDSVCMRFRKIALNLVLLRGCVVRDLTQLKSLIAFSPRQRLCSHQTFIPSWVVRQVHQVFYLGPNAVNDALVL